MASFTHKRIILFGETDAAAIVYTPRFSDYCMEAAEVWFRECIEFDWYWINTELGLGTPVVHMHIDFKSPLRAGDELQTEIRVIRLGEKSVSLSMTGLRALTGLKPEAENQSKTLVFEAEYVFCFVDSRENRAIAIPEKQRQLITAFTSDAAS